MQNETCLYPHRNKSLLIEEFIHYHRKDEEAWVKSVDDLVHGLDETSKQTIFQIIGRLYLEESGKRIVYTNAEKQEYLLVSDTLDKNIYQIAEDHYVYKNYHLPVSHFESTVFYYEHGLPELKYLEYLQGKDIIDAGAFVGDSVWFYPNIPMVRSIALMLKSKM